MYSFSGNKHFSLNLVILRLIKIMNRADKNLAQSQEIKYLKNQNFQKDFLTQKNDFESTNFEMFEDVVHKLGKSEDDMIQ